MSVVKRAGSAEEAGIRLAELASLLEGTLEGDGETRVLSASNVNDASAGDVVWVDHPRFLPAAEAGPAAAILAGAAAGPVRKPCVRVENVRLGFLRCLELFSREELPAPGIHDTAVIGAECVLGEGCSVGAYGVLGRGVSLGRGVVLLPHVVLGDGVEVGEGSVLFPHVTLYPRTVVGARVRIHAGTVVGADGFGYEWTGQGHRKKPHNGRVRIGDDVEIGANTTIDRATTGETVIGPGTKIDNLVQVAHNVRTGAHCLLVAQVGVAGSCTLGNGVVIAGQAGVSDHVDLADGVQAGAGSGVIADQPPGSVVSGYYARPHREHLRVQAALGQLPELLRRVRELERRLGKPGSAEPGEG